MAAPPSRDNIAFLPECHPTFQPDSTLRLHMIVGDCMYARLQLCLWLVFILSFFLSFVTIPTTVKTLVSDFNWFAGYFLSLYWG